jgi:hypothetical protein
MSAVTAMKRLLKAARRVSSAPESQALMMGRLLAMNVRARGPIASLSDVEFKVFSQFGDDGIIQWLTQEVALPSRTFIEFGVEDYTESTTRFLMMSDNWSGLVIDGSQDNIDSIRRCDYYWRHQLQAEAAFVDADNINGLLLSAQLGREIGLLHIDIDGNDYWVWKAIEAVVPAIVVLEYNAVFGAERAITVPYDPKFRRTEAHFSNLYFGASLSALRRLCESRGYLFVGCNSAGNNAYFVRAELASARVKLLSERASFVASMFRESRDPAGKLTLLSREQRLELIRGLPVVNVDTGRTEAL